MKKILNTLCFLLLAISINAQTTELKVIQVPDKYNNPKFKSTVTPIKFVKQLPIVFDKYQIEQQLFCNVTNCIKGSDVAFYSSKSGGKVIKKIAADNTGAITMAVKSDFSPAFAINIKEKNSSGKKGNGMIDFAKEKIFTIQNIKYTKLNENTVSFSWDASSTIKNGAFEIRKYEDDGVNYKLAGTIALNTSSNFQPYTFVDTYSENAVYSITLKNNDSQKNYLVKDFKFTNPLLVKTYPSPVNNTLVVQFETKIKNARYLITDASGKVMLEGSTTQKSTIDVSKLIKGMYLIKLTAVEGVVTKQFIKD